MKTRNSKPTTDNTEVSVASVLDEYASAQNQNDSLRNLIECPEGESIGEHAYTLLRTFLSEDSIHSLLHSDASISTLELAHQGLKDKHIAALMLLLTNNTTLTTLNIRNNKVGLEGAKALASNTTLTTLDLWSNCVYDAGATALASNTTLTTLILGGCLIGDAGATALASNTTLTTLYLDRNNVGPEGAEALASNTTLTTLDLDLNNVGPESATALASNTTLTTLGLVGNEVGDAGATALASNTTLTTLFLGSNDVGPERMEDIQSMLSKNRALYADMPLIVYSLAQYLGNPYLINDIIESVYGPSTARRMQSRIDYGITLFNKKHPPNTNTVETITTEPALK